jgi:benzoyl-CoA reductase/2-hydroxyglutaryl-CoA dehydratase subunit BcrC/BadD/HgdB
MKKLNISDVSDSDIINMAEQYAREQCEDVTETLKYTPSEIYHLVKMVWIDGYKKKTYGGD